MRAQEMTRTAENAKEEATQKNDKYISASGKREQENSRKYLIFWGTHYPYLNVNKDNERRWLPIAENSKPQIYLRSFYRMFELKELEGM